MSDYFSILKIQQGRLKKAMLDAGIKTSAELSRRSGVHQTVINSLLNFKASARRKTANHEGEYREVVLKICGVLAREPSEIFPDELNHEVPTNKIETFVERAQLVSGELGELGPYEACAKNDSGLMLRGILRHYPPQQQRVIEARFWEGKTVGEVAEEMKLSPSRIHQIEAKTLGQLRGTARYTNIEDACDFATKGDETP
jgi:RNA polymerase sigma factor (sigma-70 family)